MPFGYVLIKATTYGGLYYTANFTATGAQPVWSRITTTGLPALDALNWLAVDPFDPLNRQVVLHSTTDLYARNGGDWSKILDNTIASAATGAVISGTTSPWFDPLVQGKLVAFAGGSGFTHWALTSLDYGANWTAWQFYGGVQQNEMKSLGSHYWCGANGNVGLPNCRTAYSPDGGGSLKFVTNQQPGATAGPPVVVDKNDPTICYSANYNGVDYDLIRIDGDTVSPMTKTVMQAHIGDRLGGVSLRGDNMWIDPYNNAHMRLLSAYSGLGTATLKATTDTWGTLTTGTALGYGRPAALTHIQNTGDTTVVVFGNADSGAVSIATLSTETDYTPEARDGANATVAPYTDSIPRVSGTALAPYGIWVGEQPSSKGVYVYSVEMESDDAEWDTDVTDYAKIGSPMGGDRSSFRDMPADGFDKYHAEDVHAATPQIHAPWNSASPPGAGYGIVSDGSKWEVSSTTLALSGDLHDPVTLDADAAAILDLSTQEIGLDVQNANTVLAGPTTGAANEPTFRALVSADLPAIALDDLSDVDTSGVDTADILVYNGASWEDRRQNIRKVSTITADTMLDDTYEVVVVDATSNDILITLPGTTGLDGLHYVIKRIDSSGYTVTIQAQLSILTDSNGDAMTDSGSNDLYDSNGAGSDETIDGDNTIAIEFQYTALQLVADADANGWWIV